MVKISDILRRGRDNEEEFRKRKHEEARIKRHVRQSPPSPENKKIDKKEVDKKNEVNKKEERPPASQIDIASVMMEKTKAGRPESEGLYQELITLIKNILTRGKRREAIEGKEIVTMMERVIDQMTMVSDELMELSIRSTSDNYLYGHLVNVSLLSVKMGLELGYNKSRLSELGIAGLLHDIGTIKVIDIVNQPKRLTREEYETVKQHPIDGVEILEKAKDLSKVAMYVAHEHHEKMNGAGYPRGLKGEEINEYARLVGLANVYEALTHTRPYRKKILPYDAIKEILKDKKQFDPRFLKVVVEKIGIYPVGSWVELNTGETGKITKVNKDLPLHPTLNVIFSPEGRRLDKEKSINLAKYPTLYIKGSVDEDKLKINPKETAS